MGGLWVSTIITRVMIPVPRLGVVRLAEGIGWNTIPPAVELESGEET